MPELSKKQKDLWIKLGDIILDYSSLMVMVFTRSGKCILWSSSCRENFGWTAYQAYRMNNLLSVILPDKKRISEIKQLRSRDQKQSFTVEVRNRAKESLIQKWNVFPGDSEEIFIIAEDLTRYHIREKEFKNSQDELRRLSAHREKLLENERKRISRDIHDELGQMLSLLKLDLRWVENKLDAKQLLIGKKIRSISRVIDSLLEWVRKIAQELRPSMLDNLGLIPAMEWTISNFEKQSGIRCEFVNNLGNMNPEDEIATVLFRILQEALINVLRHSSASSVQIRIGYSGTAISLVIRDNGKGIRRDQIESPESLGLIGMRERVRTMKGKIELEGTSGKGTTLTVTIPENQGN